MPPLRRYSAKRKSDETPEPKARIAKSHEKLIFVVQRHHARNLHYDLRLELDGVLKSWAVPKGPPKTYAEKRLAIMVEDHPYDYKDFAGVIPEGNYGAGKVEIWDSGYFTVEGTTSVAEAEKKLRAGLKKGHIEWVAHGKRLKGVYILIRIASRGKEDSWLFFKKHSKGSVKRAKKDVDKMPSHVEPMLATLVPKAFDRKGWIFEIKWDGYRSIAKIHDGKVELESRNQNSFSEKFSEIVDDLQKLAKHDAILDGEIVSIDESGKPRFGNLRFYQRHKNGSLVYYVFDILYLDGKDLRELPLVERKKLLAKLLSPLKKSRIQYCDHVEEKGIAFFKEAVNLQLEGMVAKNGQSPYVMKRSKDWQKVKGPYAREK